MMKLTKLLSLVFVCCLLFTVPAFAVGYDEVTTENAYWTEENMAYVTGLANAPVSLYKRGEDGATSISSYFPGVIVEKQGEESNGYIKVRIGSSTGYFRTQDLTSDAPCTPPLTLIASSVEDVELRSGVAANAKAVAAYPGGTMLTVLGVRSDGWAHVLVEGQVGFVKCGRLAPSPVFGEAFAGVTENDLGETVAASSSDEAVVCCPNSNDMLSLRKRADISAPYIGKYYNGTIVKLLEAPKDGWVKVQIGELAEGYVQTSHLAMNGQNVTVCHREMVIANKSGTGLNMRSKPETNGKKIQLYENGTVVTVIGQWYNDWYHVIVDGQYGFMQNRLAEID